MEPTERFSMFQQVASARRPSDPIRKYHAFKDCSSIHYGAPVQEVVRYDTDPPEWRGNLCALCGKYLHAQPIPMEETRAAGRRILALYGITKSTKCLRAQPSIPEEFRAAFESIRARYTMKGAHPAAGEKTP